MNTKHKITILTENPSINGTVHVQFSNEETDEYIVVSHLLSNKIAPVDKDVMIMFSDFVSQEILEEALSYFKNKPDIAMKIAETLV